MNAQSEMRVLFVEDNPDDVLLTKAVFRKLGVRARLDFVGNGRDAIAELDGTRSPPDVLFLDINLPLVSGLEVLRNVRARRFVREPAVIVMTTSTAPEDERRAHELGCNEFHVKPLGFSEFAELLVGVLRRWLPAAVA